MTYNPFPLPSLTRLYNMQDGIIREFLTESTEILDRVDRDLVALEQNPSDPELLASVFRGVHTIKGTCSFLGFSHLEATAHAGENLLSGLRDGSLTLTVEITSALLRLFDVLRSILVQIEEDGTEGERDDADLIQTLHELRQGDHVAEHESCCAEESLATENKPVSIKPDTSEQPEDHSEPETLPEGDAAESEPAESESAVVEAAAEASQSGPGSVEPADKSETPGHTDAAQKTNTVRETRSATDTTIRVSVSLLDTMMNLVGELVLARNQVVQHAHQLEDQSLATSTQHLGLITSELQQSVMQTRLQPIEVVFDKLPRLVRDAALACRKEVRLELDGRDTELDRTLIEAIKDPLTHMVRNAVDHGIEAPDERVAKGKPAEGTVALRAYHEGGQVVIELSDDGTGINIDKLKAKAVDAQAITPEQAVQMSDHQAQHLIFNAGLSTAQTVSTISGRGVGMDVVRTNIEQIGGQVSVSSTPGTGTRFQIRIPLTLAIIPALIVAGQKQSFAIPQVCLQELVRIDGHERAASIETVCGTPVYRLRGELLPLVNLSRELGLAEPASSPELEGAPEDAAKARAINIIVLQTERCNFGLIVEDICDTEEVVVKPISTHLKQLGVYTGATIRGDGTVALILDVDGLARRARLEFQHAEAVTIDDNPETVASMEETQTFMLISVGDDRRVAIPMDVVLRLEERRAHDIEWIGDRPVLQYRGRIIDVVFLRELLHMHLDQAEGQDAQRTIVVCEVDGRQVGLVVDHIVDVVDEALDYATTDEPTSTCIVQDKVAEVLNPLCLIRAHTAIAGAWA